MIKSNRIIAVFILVFAAQHLTGCAPAAAPVAGGVASWIGSYLLGKGADLIWDGVTGKPDLAEFDRRIVALENDPRFKGQYLESIAELRDRIIRNPDISKKDYIQFVNMTIAKIDEIDQRLKLAEQQIADLQRESRAQSKNIDDLKTGNSPIDRPSRSMTQQDREDIEKLDRLLQKAKETNEALHKN